MPSKRQKIEHENVAVGAGAAMTRHPLSAVAGPTAVESQEAQTASTRASTSKGSFRFWHEERRFKGSGERCIVQRALFENGGVRIGGYPKSAPIPGPLGWQRPGDWDFLWAPARLALKAVEHLKPGQLVSAVPGLMSITKKRRLPSTLKEALGEELAWDIVPRSFSLPDELPQLAAFAKAASAAYASASTGPAAGAPAAAGGAAAAAPLSASDAEPSSPRGAASEAVKGGPQSRQLPQQQQQQQEEPGSGTGAAAAGSCAVVGSQPQELWILKTAQHLGKGLKLVPLEAAAAEAGRPRRRPNQKPYVLAQRYVDRPLLINGRKFGIRVWVAVTGFNPLRAYLHANGLVLFSTHGYDNKTWRTEAGDVALGHVTNYAQNMDGTVWSLKQLEEHMGAEAYGKMWRKVQRNSALVIAAALKHIKADHETLKVPSGMTCEVVGLDYLVDEDLHPWLLEVNGTPSLQVEHEDARVEQLIHEQKYGMVQDLMTLLNVRERFKPRYAALRAAAKAKQQAATAAAAAAVASGGGSGAMAAAVAAVAVAAAAKPNAALTRKLKEQLQPTSDAAVMARVVQELSYRGGFEPLMALMPLDQQPGVSVPWDARDFELRQAMESAAAAAAAAGDGAATCSEGLEDGATANGAVAAAAAATEGSDDAPELADDDGDDDDDDDDGVEDGDSDDDEGDAGADGDTVTNGGSSMRSWQRGPRRGVRVGAA